LNDRIKQVRKALNLTQTDFANRLNLTRNFIFLVEKGERQPSDRTISDICREFNVNEDWLRTGEGEPFIPDDMLYFTKIGRLAKQNHPIKRILLEVIDTLTDDQCDELYKKFKEYETGYLGKEKE